ncbi:MAG: hypothetical protein GX279_02905 [Clostridiaceae bacterium]|nr:hypothetical protein [Clostridiaceae bacterium]
MRLRRSVRVSAILLVFVLLYFSGMHTISLAADSRPIPQKVLILHSYSEGFQWTSDQNDGILKKFNETNEIYEFFVEYMDWKNFPDQENLKHFRERMIYKYSSKKIDIIITTDDAALEFALDNRDELFSGAPVVFSGINKKGAEEIAGKWTSVTGVIEEIDPVGTIKAALQVNPGIRNVYVLFDNTESGLTTGEITAEAIHEVKPLINIIPLNDMSMDEIMEVTGNASNDSIVICTTYTVDKNGYVTGLEILNKQLCSNSRVPVYHLYDLALGSGAIGGSMIVGRLQGEEAAELALRVLKGEDIQQMPFVSKPTARYMFDYEVLRRFSISPGLLPEGSELINMPNTRLDEYKNFVIAATIIVVMLLIFITILLFYLKRVHSMRKELSDSNIQLTGLYEDLTVASNKLKRQYDELTAVQNDLSSSEYRLELIFDKMINGFYIFEPVYNSRNRLKDVRFLKVTPGFFHNLEIPEQDIIGKTWSEVFGQPNAALGYFQNLLDTGRVERFEICSELKGSYFLIEPFLINENQIGVMFENITEYKKAIKAVKRLNAELEKRVADRTARLQEAMEELESFSYTVSHDLKSPLRAVDGYVGILLEDFGEKLDSDAVQMLNNISTISRDSIDMINKILQYSKTSRAVLNMEHINFEEKISSVFTEMQHAYSDRKAELVIETGLPEVYVDRVLLRQMLQNILSNCFKFTEGREKAIITVGCTITEDHYVFYIKDNGVGFDMKYSGKLFGLFQRLHTPDEFEGSGIGLVTVKKIVERHGGRVWVESKEDEGTSVFFTLPIKQV